MYSIDLVRSVVCYIRPSILPNNKIAYQICANALPSSTLYYSMAVLTIFCSCGISRIPIDHTAALTFENFVVVVPICPPQMIGHIAVCTVKKSDFVVAGTDVIDMNTKCCASNSAR